jgi:hypothetical protein
MQSEVNFSTDEDGNEQWIKIPMVAELEGEGAAKVTIDAKDSAVTEGTYTFANGSDGNTTASIDDTKTFRDTVTIENVVIEENVINTFGDTTGTATEVSLKLLDSDFEWETTGTLTFSGGFDHVAIPMTDGAVTIDGNELDVDVTAIYGAGETAGTTRGTMTFEGLQVNPDSDASYGEVKIKVYGDEVTSETLVIGEYVDYTVTVKADDDEEDLPVLYAGELDGYTVYDKAAAAYDTANEIKDLVEAGDADAHKLSPLVIEEEVAKSWIISRETKIEFPDWVEIIDVDITSVTNIDEDDGTDVTTAEDAGSAGNGDWNLSYSPGDSDVTFENLDAEDEEATMDIELTFYVSVEADAAGDIIATVSGKSIGEEHEVKLGTAVAPITAEVEIMDVKIGVQDQATGKITITEYEEEVLNDAEEIEIILDTEDGLDWSATPDADVTKGDMTIDDVEKNSGTITVTIDDESTETSTFEVTGFEVDVNRVVPEGDFNVAIGGNSIVKNYEADGDWFAFDTDTVVDVKYVRIITPAPGDTQAGEQVTFTIDAMEYKIGEEVITMDAAPFIDASNRTMLPLRAFANALGVADENIVWNGTERSVTIFKGDAVVKVIIDQMSFMKNGVSVPMDTSAVIKNGRTFLPVRALGQALGADIGWDAATRTVTID